MEYFQCFTVPCEIWALYHCICAIKAPKHVIYILTYERGECVNVHQVSAHMPARVKCSFVSGE